MSLKCNFKKSILFAAGAAFFISPMLYGKEDSDLREAVSVIDEYKSPGLEAEISGIFPHPENDDLYLALVNKKPPYRNNQGPRIEEQYLGHLVVVQRDGTIVQSIDLANDDFGGLAYADGLFYAALTNSASIIPFDLESGKIYEEIELPSPAGGLAYDKKRNALIAQLYVEHPALAVVDLASKSVTEILWSDESAMGLAKVDGDWLCTWASGWDPGSFSELRVLDQTSGHVISRIMLDKVHSSLAPTSGPSGESAFLSLVTLDSYTGETVIRRYRYSGTS